MMWITDIFIYNSILQLLTKMTYTKEDHYKKRAYQAGVALGIIAAPFTGGLSLFGSIALAIKGRKYNSFLQEEDEYYDEKIYYKQKEILQIQEKFNQNEENLLKSCKTIEDKVKRGGIKIE